MTNLVLKCDTIIDLSNSTKQPSKEFNGGWFSSHPHFNVPDPDSKLFYVQTMCHFVFSTHSRINNFRERPKKCFLSPSLGDCNRIFTILLNFNVSIRTFGFRLFDSFPFLQLKIRHKMCFGKLFLVSHFGNFLLTQHLHVTGF